MIGGDLNLYSNGKNKPKTLTGFSDKQKAIKTIKNISKFPIIYQKQIVITMYNRAKYHPYRNKNIIEAMQIYSKWMKKHNIVYNSTSRNKKTQKHNKTNKKRYNKTYKKNNA